MPRSFALSFALLCAPLACDSGNSLPKQRPIEFMLAERARNDPRPDSFTIAADRGRVIGSETAAVWIVIVSDFQCAGCKRWHDETFPLLKKEYVETGKVRMAFVNLPSSIHFNAVPTALAAACASAEGRFWEAHDRIFETQDAWKDLPDAKAFLDSLAIAAGVNAAVQRQCTERARGMKLIRLDTDRSRAAGADSAPTFFVGQRRLLGAAPIATFRAVIDSALAGK